MLNESEQVIQVQRGDLIEYENDCHEEWRGRVLAVEPDGVVIDSQEIEDIMTIAPERVRRIKERLGEH